MRVRPKEHASMSSSSQVVPITPDVLVRNEGTVFLFCPLPNTLDALEIPCGEDAFVNNQDCRAQKCCHPAVSDVSRGMRPHVEQDGQRFGTGIIGVLNEL